MRPLIAWLLLAASLVAAQAAPIRVAVYDDKGATGKGIPAVEKILGDATKARIPVLNWNRFQSLTGMTD